MIIILLFSSRYKLVYVSGESMQPALDNQSIVVADKWKNPKKGDIVIALPENFDYCVIKRVAAEGGEIWEGIRVPEDAYFLLGDNALVSLDSRHFGCVEKNRIKGTVIFSF